MTIIIFNQKRAIHVFAREDTPVADRSNLNNFLEIASSLDDSLLATTFWNGKGRLELILPQVALRATAGFRHSFK